MRWILWSVFFLLFVSGLYAQKTDTFKLWTGTVPQDDRLKLPAVTMPDTSGNVIRLTDVTDPLLVAFYPEEKNRTGISIIVCPGGGYHKLAIDLEGYEIAEWLSSWGITAYVLQYRVPGKREAALLDLQRALEIVNEQSGKMKMDKHSIGILGFSAGGHLAMRSLISVKEKDPVLKHLFRPDFGVLIYPAYFDQAPEGSLSPEIHITQDLPPVFVFATADDYFANSALVLVKALRDAGHHPEFHLMPEGGHGYGMRVNNSAGKIWPGLLKLWVLDSGF